MSATASRIALSAPQSVSGVQGHAPTVPEPVRSATGAARLLPRRDHGGRFAPRATYPCCEGCGWVLAESLAGRSYCANGRCQHYRTDAGAVPGVDAGVLAVVPGE